MKFEKTDILIRGAPYFWNPKNSLGHFLHIPHPQIYPILLEVNSSNDIFYREEWEEVLINLEKVKQNQRISIGGEQITLRELFIRTNLINSAKDLLPKSSYDIMDMIKSTSSIEFYLLGKILKVNKKKLVSSLTTRNVNLNNIIEGTKL